MRTISIKRNFVVKAAMTLLFAMLTTATAWAANPIKAHLDVCEGIGNTIHITGWCYDTRDPATSLSMYADVYFQSINSDRYTSKSLMADAPRPDVNQAFGITGNHGFDCYIPIEDWGVFYLNINATSYYGDEGVWNTFAVGVMATVQPHITGWGTSVSPFIIKDTQDWKEFAANVAAGYEQNNYELALDFDNSNDPVTVMVGSSSHPFDGHFNGWGRTITVNITGNEQAVAPFHVVKGATIENVNVAGNVTSTEFHTSGLVGSCHDNNVFRNCTVSATVNSPSYVGGFVGHSGNSTFLLENCVFSGILTSFNKFAGGLVGWCESSTMRINNCLFKGTVTPASGGRFHPVGMKWDRGVPCATVTDVYYLNTVSPSTDLGLNAIPGAQCEPVNIGFVFEEWERVVQCPDDNSYFARTITPKAPPYDYGFEDGLNGWTLYNCDPQTGIRSNDKLNGTYSFKFEQCDHEQVLISPEIASNMSLIKVSFHLKGTTNKNVAIRLGYSNSTNDIDDFTWSEEFSDILSAWEELYTNYPSGFKYLAIKCSANSSPVYFDDISFTMPYPVPANIKLAEVTETSATFTWEPANASVQNYNYKFKPVNGSGGSIVITSNTTATFSDLTPNTEYEFSIQAIYEDGKSNFVVLTFKTKEAVIPLPYTDSFEGNMAWRMVDCFTTTGVTAEAQHEGSRGFKFGKTDRKQYIISPLFDGTQPMKVTFWYKNADSSQPAYFLTGYVVNPDDPVVFSNLITASSGEWTQGEFYCPIGTQRVVVLWYMDENHFGGPLYLDDFSFEVGLPSPWAGSGTQAAPYMITTPELLNTLAQNVNSGETYEGKYFKLGADLAYQHTTAWNDVNSTENNFTPIGYMRGDDNDFVMFCGHFDGAGYTISGIRIYKDGTDEKSKCQGLFGVIGENAEVKNLTLADARVTGHWSTGGLAGLIYDSKNSTIITNCRVAADVAIHAVRNEAHVHGGLVGHNYCTISNCISSATLTIADEAKGANNSSIFGGLVGGNGGNLKNNLVIGATIPATSDNEQGAIVGYNIPTEWLDGSINSNLEHNLYYNCNVAGVANATNVGYYDLLTYVISDLTENDGAVIATELTKAPANGTSGVDYIPYGGKFYAPASHTVTFSSEGYTTYYNSESAVTLPPGVKARIVVAVNADGSVTYETIADGDSGENTVPAGVAVVLTSKTVGLSHKAASYILNIGGDDNRTFAENLLHGSDEATTTTGGSTYYRMGYDENGQNKGWYWAANGGGAFESSGHEAWLAVPTQAADDTPLPLPGYDRDNVTTSIADRTSNAMPADEPWYTVDGRKVDGKSATKGVYIRNGRKVVIK